MRVTGECFTRRRFALGAAAGSAFCCAAQPGNIVPSEWDFAELPTTVSASCVGHSPSRFSWYLSVNSAREAELTVVAVPKNTRRRFQVPKAKLAEFSKTLHSERFFELAPLYGRRVPDGSSRTIAVTVGETTKVVRLDYLSNEVDKDAALLRDACRA